MRVYLFSLQRHYCSDRQRSSRFIRKYIELRAAMAILSGQRAVGCGEFQGERRRLHNYNRRSDLYPLDMGACQCGPNETKKLARSR